MQSIFRYPGGKTRKSVKERVISRFPTTGYQEYREPFVGGGGIFFEIDPKIPRWVNDVDCGLISVYEALKHYPQEFIAKCRAIPCASPEEPLASAKPGGKPLYNARLKGVFETLIDKRQEEPALAYFFVNRTVWGGRVNYNLPSRLYFSNPNGWNVINTNLLESAAKHCADVQITCGDYKPLLEAPGEDVLIYCDPPYYVQSETSRASQLYDHCFGVEQHVELHNAVRECRHKVLLSYDDVDFIRDLYKDFNISSDSWKYCGTSSAVGQSKTKRLGREIFIRNF